MRRVDRKAVPVPASLAPHLAGRSRQSKGATELARNTEFFAANQPKSMKFEAYGEDSVKAALHALFHGKCAYCESFYDATAPVDVEHFRPKGKVAGNAAHPGYWWLAADWDNLLPSCIDCNRRRRQRIVGPDAAPMDDRAGKQDHFPVTGAHVAGPGIDISTERPLLVDPCQDDPANHLALLVDSDPPLALVLPRDPADGPQRGTTSIAIFGLNRLALVQSRTRILRRLELLRTVLARLDEAARLLETSTDPGARKALASVEVAVGRLLEDLRAMADDTEPHCTMVREWLRRWAEDLAPGT
jgi:uncharacterized protein (TIGR02646 family)